MREKEKRSPRARQLGDRRRSVRGKAPLRLAERGSAGKNRLRHTHRFVALDGRDGAVCGEIDAVRDETRGAVGKCEVSAAGMLAAEGVAVGPVPVRSGGTAVGAVVVIERDGTGSRSWC